MNKIAFIDLAFHKKTKSSDFFKELLLDYEIDFYYDTSLEWGYSDKSYLKNQYNIYLYWQVVPSFKDLLKIKDKSIFLVPMYDWIILNKYFWEQYKWFNIKILCFSKKIYDFFSSEWFDCMYIQYFLKPLNYNLDYSQKILYYRDRWRLEWEEIKTIIWNQKIDLFTIKTAIDPWHSALNIPEKDIKKYNINYINKFFDTHEEHYENLSKHNIFIAPRKKEGIWMSFLDSMSLWQCIIVYDDSTMNEYIEHWYNWLITDFKSEIDLNNFEKIWKKCKEEYIKEYEKWGNNKRKIIDFMEWKYKSVSRIKIKYYIIYLLIIMRRFILRLKNNYETLNNNMHL